MRQPLLNNFKNQHVNYGELYIFDFVKIISGIHIELLVPNRLVLCVTCYIVCLYLFVILILHDGFTSKVEMFTQFISLHINSLSVILTSFP